MLQLLSQVCLGALCLVLRHLQYLVRLELLLPHGLLATLHFLHGLLEFAYAVLLFPVDILELALGGLKVRELIYELLLRTCLAFHLQFLIVPCVL